MNAVDHSTAGLHPASPPASGQQKDERELELDVDLDITGMSCASCAARIEKVVSRVPGVAAINVNLATERARIRASTATDTLVAAIERAGFGARPVPAAPAPVPTRETPGAADAGKRAADRRT
ncbi:MAG: cation transporter, partial [Janthinobacterium lividum]